MLRSISTLALSLVAISALAFGTLAVSTVVNLPVNAIGAPGQEVEKWQSFRDGFRGYAPIIDLDRGYRPDWDLYRGYQPDMDIAPIWPAYASRLPTARSNS